MLRRTPWLLVLACSCVSPSTDSRDRHDRFAAHFGDLEARGKFNGVVLVADRGEIIYRRAHGFRDLESRAPLDVESAFKVGSVSKPITAVAVLQLAERGRLGLDDPLPKYFPKLPYPGVTIRGLLSHTSGLFDVYGDARLRERFYAWYGKTDPPYSNGDYLGFLEAQAPPLIGAPGERSHYSNTAYVLLALIVEQVSGRPFDEVLRENIFTPAGMRATHVYSLSKDRQALPLATGFALDMTDGSRHPVVLPPTPPRIYGLTYGDDEIVTTADDLLAFDRALRSGTLLKPGTLRAALAPPTLSDGRPADYGLGFAVRRDERGRVVSHSGSTSGFLAYVRFSVSDAGTTLVILTNVPPPGPQFRQLIGDVTPLAERRP